MQHASYIRAVTICPCPVTKIDNPGTPRMCEYCDLLHRVICKSPTNDCLACTLPNTDANNLSTCPICVLYALSKIPHSRIEIKQINGNDDWHIYLLCQYERYIIYLCYSIILYNIL